MRRRETAREKRLSLRTRPDRAGALPEAKVPVVLGDIPVLLLHPFDGGRLRLALELPPVLAPHAAPAGLHDPMRAPRLLPALLPDRALPRLHHEGLGGVWSGGDGRKDGPGTMTEGDQEARDKRQVGLWCLVYVLGASSIEDAPEVDDVGRKKGSEV